MIPNILTTFRLIIIPFFAYSILYEKSIWLSVSLFLLSGATDIVDGWIARKYNMITDVGSVYDPLVDKLMQITAVVCLAIIGVVPWWLIAFVLIKEITMIITGSVLYIKKIVVHSNWYGKAATVFFYTIIFILIIFPDINDGVKDTLIGMLVGVLVLAGVGYLLKIVGKNKGDVCDKRA
ncbi:MAG: CDP-alcohol phosphatidyltransferase family protein [Clostridia bacterium]|nr:CDP-alcohol phosphatidyltransferase family protein [Clostridia bacterium]